MTEVPPAKAAHWGRTLVGGLATVAALSLAVYFSMDFLNSYDSATAPITVYAVLARSFLFSARLGTCVALLIVSPVLLWLALRLSRAPVRRDWRCLEPPSSWPVRTTTSCGLPLNTCFSRLLRQRSYPSPPWH